MRLSILLSLLTGALAGCDGGSSSPTGPVAVQPITGQVIYDGKPAANVRVTLVPIDAPSPPRIPQYPNGTTDAEGKFHLTTYAANDGAPEGGYQVVLDSTKRNNVDNLGSEDGLDADLFKGWYDTMHSQLNVRVKLGVAEIPAFKIAKITKPAGMSEGVPGRN